MSRKSWKRLALGLVLAAAVTSAGCFYEGEEGEHEHGRSRHRDHDYHLTLPANPGKAAVGQPSPYVGSRRFYSQMTP